MRNRQDSINDTGRKQSALKANGGAGILSVLLPLLRVFVFLTTGIGLLLPGQALAQGDGPHTILPAPVATDVFTFTFMDLKSNYNFAQNIQIKDADLNVRIYALDYRRFIPVGDLLGFLSLPRSGGSIDGKAVVDPLATGANRTINVPRQTGFGDPYLGFRLGLIGTRALKPADFVKHKWGFQLSGQAGFYPPVGQYNSSTPLNLGTNRWTLQFNAPIVMPFGNPARPVTLESNPQIYIYTDNNEFTLTTTSPFLSVEGAGSSSRTRFLCMRTTFPIT